MTSHPSVRPSVMLLATLTTGVGISDGAQSTAHLSFYCNCLWYFCAKSETAKHAFEIEMETYKLLLAASKYCVQFDSVLHTLPEIFREYRTGCAGVVQSGRSFPSLHGL